MIVEKSKNVFTKEDAKNIIRKKYNPSTANNKKYLQRKGLLMKKIEDITLNEVMKELNWKERIIIRIFNKAFNKVSNLIRIKMVNNIIK